jgi:hypothetical protein
MQKADHPDTALSKRRKSFRTPEAEKELLSLYDALVKDYWPDGCVERQVETSFGSTHVIESGPPSGEPLVLSHALSISSAMWHANIRALSRDHRVYCVDRVNEAGKSLCSRPPRSLAAYASG